MTTHADWLEAVRTAFPHDGAVERFAVEGLAVELRAIDRALIEWVLEYLKPLPTSASCGTERNYAVTYLHSDDLVLAVMRQLQDIDLVVVRRHGRDRYLRRARPRPGVVVYCDPDEGVLWISDLAFDAVFIVVSSRTRLPALAFASVTRELVTHHLAAQGWTLFHAGAVDTEAGALMVIGHAGAGKTSLLLALLAGGARLIANELLFVREADPGVQVLGFPMAVAVGLGTALRFAPLAELIESPDELRFPRQRLDRGRIVQASRSEWPELEDKITLLPSELSERLGAPAAIPGAILRFLVVPQVSRESTTAVTAEPLSRSAAFEIVSDNHIGLTEDSRHRPWLELNFDAAPARDHDRLLARLCALDPVCLRFGLPDSGADESYARRLLGALG